MTRAVFGLVGVCALTLTALTAAPASACPGDDAKKQKAPPSALDISAEGTAPSACPDGDNAKKTPAPPPPQG
jgi:hypothetical protein